MCGKMENTKIIAQNILERLNSSLLDEDQCRRFVLETLHSSKQILTCPQCHEELSPRAVDRFWMNERVHCPSCNKFYKATTSTIFEGVHISFSDIILLGILTEFRRPLSAIAKTLRLNPVTVKVLIKRFNYPKPVKN